MEGEIALALRPTSRLRFDLTYIHNRLGTLTRAPAGTEGIFTNHIFRGKLSYQFTRELSLRVILDSEAVLPNTALVDLEREQRLGLDLLLTYLLHPGTAVHVGYTDGYENLAFAPEGLPRLRRTGSPTTSTGRQAFMKLSYQFRF